MEIKDIPEKFEVIIQFHPIFTERPATIAFKFTKAGKQYGEFLYLSPDTDINLALEETIKEAQKAIVEVDELLAREEAERALKGEAE